MEAKDALPLRAAVRHVSRECFPRKESIPEVEQLIDGFIDDFPGQKAFNAACGRGASVRALEYLLGRSAPDWNEAIKSAARGGHLRVLQWMVAKREDRRGPWRTEFAWTLQEAAGQGHLETVKWLYGYDPQSAQALGAAAGNRHMDVVEWLWDQGARGGDFDPMDAAAANGHLEVVKWLHERGVPGSRAMQNAAAGGHLEVVKWLYSNGGGYSADVMDAAAANGHLEVVQWLHANINRLRYWGDMCTDRAYVSAVCNGHFEVMKVVAGAHGTRRWMTVADDAARHGRLDALKWIYNHGRGYLTAKTMDIAATHGHLEVVKWLHARKNVYKKGCTQEAMNGAAKNGHLAVVEWLHDNRTEGCTTAAMDGAAVNGHLDVVCWLHDYRTQGCTGNAIKWAAGNGHLEVVEWLLKVYGSEFLIPDLMDSAALAACGGLPEDSATASDELLVLPSEIFDGGDGECLHVWKNFCCRVATRAWISSARERYSMGPGDLEQAHRQVGDIADNLPRSASERTRRTTNYRGSRRSPDASVAVAARVPIIHIRPFPGCCLECESSRYAVAA